MINCRIFIIGLFFLFSPNCFSQKLDKDKDWEILFDGNSFNGWHRFNNDKVGNVWIIKNGTMEMVPTKRDRRDRKSHDILTNKEYTNFILSLEWKISEKGNSGILWGIQEGKKYKAPYRTGPEIQIIDNNGHPDAKVRPNFHQAGALYDLSQPTIDNTKPAGQWNELILTVNYKINRGKLILNGKEINNFPLYGDQWEKLIAKSKFAHHTFKNFSKKRKGKIGLQDHGNIVSYRNIKIKKL
jgi:hypothetical protein